jgi:hypothetical protein
VGDDQFPKKNGTISPCHQLQGDGMFGKFTAPADLENSPDAGGGIF